MGFLRWLLGPEVEQEKPKRQVRGKARPANERLAREEAAYLAHLRKTNPAKWAQIMEARMGLGIEKEDEFAQLEAMIARLKRMGLIKNPRDLSDDEDGMVRDLIKALAPALAPALGGLLAAQQRSVAPTPAVITAPAQINPPAQAVQAEPAASQEAPVPMSFLSRLVIAQLQNKSPREAAEWLQRRKEPEVRGVVDSLCQTPDERLPELLDAVAKQAPDYAGLIDWLRKRPEWLLAAIHELRLMRQGTATL